MAVKRKKEGTTFATYLEIVTLSDGTEIELPRLTSGKMARVSTSLAVLIDAASEKAPEGLFENWAAGKGGDDMGAQLIKLLPQIFPLVLSEIIELMAAYLDEPKEWVEELTIEDLSLIFSPFLKSILRNMNLLLGMIGLQNIINIQDGTVSDQVEPVTLELVSPIAPQEQPTQ